MGSCHSGGLHETSLESLATILMRQNKAQCLSSTLRPLSRQYGTPTLPLLHDVWFEVLLFLHPSTVAKVFRVCSVLRDFCEEQALWRAFILRDRTKSGEPLTFKVATDSTIVTMDYYWLYRVGWCVKKWGKQPVKSVVFEPWRSMLISCLVNSDHLVHPLQLMPSRNDSSLTVTRITMGRCCHPHSCLTISTEETLNGTVHRRTFHAKFDDQDSYQEWYLNLALRSGQCPLREPLCIHPKDPYAKGLSEEDLEVCRTHAILPRDFCRLRDALQREVQLVRDSHSFFTGHRLVGPVKMCEVGVQYHGRTLGLRLDLVQAAHLWRAYVKLGMIYHDTPSYPFLL